MESHVYPFSDLRVFRFLSHACFLTQSFVFAGTTGLSLDTAPDVSSQRPDLAASRCSLWPLHATLKHEQTRAQVDGEASLTRLQPVTFEEDALLDERAIQCYRVRAMLLLRQGHYGNMIQFSSSA